MDISACPRCASRSMHAPTMGDGGILGISTTAQAVCERCGFQGAPLLFEDQADYEDFRAAVERGANPLEEKEDPSDADVSVGFDALQDIHRPGNRAAAAFTAFVGIGVVAVALFTAVAYVVSGPGQGTLPAFAFSMALQLGVALAFLAIARRLWRGSAPPADAPQGTS